MSKNASTVIFRHRSAGAHRAKIRRFLKELAQEIVPGRSVTCLIADDAELRRLNRQFRGKDYATDVLSFPPDDIAVSFDRAAVQAEELGHSAEDEMRILILHGLLHLAGMDHERDKGAMARAETRWRKRLGLPCGLIERATA